MSGSNRTNKSVSFDLDDEFEVEVLKHAEKEFNGKKRNFSKYVIRLIAEDMKGTSSGGYPVKKVDNPVNEDKGFYSMEVKDAMSTFY